MIVASCKPKIGVWGDTKFSTDTFERRYVVFIFCLTECCVPGKRKRILHPAQFKQNSPHCEIYMKPEKNFLLEVVSLIQNPSNHFSRLASCLQIIFFDLHHSQSLRRKKQNSKFGANIQSFGPANQRLDSCELL